MLKRLAATVVVVLALVPSPPASADRSYVLCDARRSSLCAEVVSVYEFEEGPDAARRCEVTGAVMIEPDGSNVARAAGKIGSYAFDHTATTTSYLTTRNTFGLTGTFTASLWLYVNTPPSNGTTMLVEHVDELGTTTLRPFLFLENSGGTTVVKWLTRNAITGADRTISSTTALSTGQWYHVIWGQYRNPTSSNLLQERQWISINGGTPSYTDWPDPSATSAGHTRYGAVWSGSGWQVGAYRIDQFAVWARRLRDDERATLYNSGTGRAYPFY